MADKKPALKQSEFWISLVGSILSLLVLVLNENEVALAIASTVAFLLSAAVYAYFRTPLPSEKPGWKTKTFWVSILTVLGSVAAAISGADLPGIPESVTKVAAMITAGLTAGGYTLYRYQGKMALSRKASS